MLDTDFSNNFMRAIVPDNIVQHPRINHFSIAMEAMGEANILTERFYMRELIEICKIVWCKLVSTFDEYQEYLDEDNLEKKLKTKRTYRYEKR